MQKTFSILGVLVAVLVAVTISPSYAEGRVTGRSVKFYPYPLWVGETTVISVKFTVTGGSVNLTATVEQTTPRPEGPPPPTIVLGTFNPGEHTVDVYRYTVPPSPPERICWNIKMTGGEFRNVCLKRGSAQGRWFMNVESYGQWVEAIPAPIPVPSAEKPDLRIVGNLAIADVLQIENIGRGTAYNVCAVKECFVEGRWVRSGGEFAETRTLGPGRSVVVRIGRLGRSVGPCPSGTTKVRVVVDPRNEIAETDENNNVVEASTLADLRIVDFFAFEADEKLRVRFKITNTGVNDAGRFAWDISIFRDGEWRSFIGEGVSGLLAGSQTDIIKNIGMILGRNICIPDNRGYCATEVRLRLRVDSLNQVTESNEADNIAETIFRK